MSGLGGAPGREKPASGHGKGEACYGDERRTVGKIPMPNAEQETKWRSWFEELGESEVHDRLYHGGGIYPDEARQCALQWLREKAAERTVREKQTHRYAWLCT
jgi:hypothetical protein